MIITDTAARDLERLITEMSAEIAELRAAQNPGTPSRRPIAARLRDDAGSKALNILTGNLLFEAAAKVELLTEALEAVRAEVTLTGALKAKVDSALAEQSGVL